MRESSVEITIRDAIDGDLGPLLALYQHFPRPDDSDPEAVERAWREIMARPGLHVYVGEQDGQLVTSCTLAVVPNLRSGPRPYGLLELVVTHVDFRRRGYGTAVVQHALDRAWAMDCYKVMLLTGQSDDAVLRFYEGTGLSPHGKTGFVAAAP